MKPELQLISEKLRERYQMNDQMVYEMDTVEAEVLLTEKRLDLGAKLYYIQCYVTGQGLELAEQLYRKHLSSMQYEVLQGRDDTEQLNESLRNFQELIHSFQQDEFDLSAIKIPVGNSYEILDGSHITACAIYFQKKLGILRFLELDGEPFDFDIFLQNGLEQGYLELMAGTFAWYRKDCVGRYNLGENNHYRRLIDLKRATEEAGCHMIYAKKVEKEKGKGWYYIFYSERRKKLTEELCRRHFDEIKEELELDKKEQHQSIEITTEEESHCKKVRDAKCRQTKYLMAVRKALHLPVKKNKDGYGCVKQQR